MGVRAFGGWWWPAAALVLVGCGDDAAPSPCAGIDCSGHGVCFVSGTTPYCDCARGYHAEGLACLPGDPPEACRGVTCSGHGTCVATSGGVPSCNCFDGYVPDGLECVPATCGAVWMKTLPGLSAYGVAAAPGGGAIYVAGNMGSTAVVMQLDACGELVRQQVFAGPADTWSVANRLLFDGGNLHAFGSYEPWDSTATPTDAGVLHAVLEPSPLELLEERELSTGDGWDGSWFPAAARGDDGSWWIGGGNLRYGTDHWIYHARVVREGADGSHCVGVPTAEPESWVEAVAAFDGRVWLSGVTPTDDYLRTYAPEGEPASESCIGEPDGDWTLRPPALGWFFGSSILEDGDGVLMVGEGGSVDGGVAVRLRWSETEGWLAPTPWNPTEGYDRFHRAARGPAGELCAVGVGDYTDDTAENYDGLFACYEPRTLAARFEHFWPEAGGCTDVALDAAGGLLVVCSGWIDTKLLRCLPTGECPAIP
ncbi:MAG: hypothetical protein JXB32_09915 [Deltaproteobacteria bacterium]|nr:hypothetical protein [Deltaproteobacteria bacterium]